MKARRRGLVWWSWLLTGLALGAGVSGWTPGIPAAIALTALSAILAALRAGKPTACSVQVRVTFLAFLLVGTYSPLFFVHFMQLAGTAMLLVFDYCVLARTLSLLPWNRRGPLTLARVKAAYLLPRVKDGILAELDAVRS